MALVLLEGLDRTGKSSVASYFETLGFKNIHLSAPTKGTTPDQYLQEMIDLMTSAAAKDLVLDRTHYGELVWPQIYGRKPLLNDETIEVIREVEESVGVQRIWMMDNSVEAHWKRCVDNKEPLNKQQFVKARALFSEMAHKYGFEPITLQQFITKFPDAANHDTGKQLSVNADGSGTVSTETIMEVAPQGKLPPGKSPEQHKLEIANAINDVLSKRILKVKGNVYDDIENDIRIFLNSKLGKLLGSVPTEITLTQEETKFYKAMYKKAIQGDR
jgi:hypothetical protein